MRPVIEAAIKMKNLDVGSLPVRDGERLQGFDRDISVRLVAEGRDAFTTKVNEIMPRGSTYCFDDQTWKKRRR
jgi:CBS domain-containing protein